MLFFSFFFLFLMELGNKQSKKNENDDVSNSNDDYVACLHQFGEEWFKKIANQIKDKHTIHHYERFSM